MAAAASTVKGEAHVLRDAEGAPLTTMPRFAPRRLFLDRAAGSWIELPAFDGRGNPKFRRGVSPAEGLYFIGLPWLHTWGAGRFLGIAEDSAHLAGIMAERLSDVHHAQDGISGNALADRRERGAIAGYLYTVHHLDRFADPTVEASRWFEIVRDGDGARIADGLTARRRQRTGREGPGGGPGAHFMTERHDDRRIHSECGCLLPPIVH